MVSDDRVSNDGSVIGPSRPLADVHPSVGYRASPFFQFRLGEDRRLVYLPLDGQVQVVASEDVRLLSGCRHFKSLGTHLNDCGASEGSAGVECLRDRLRQLAQKRLLSPLRTAAEERPTTASESARRIAWVTIPARGNVGEVTRCLAGCLATIATFGHQVRVLVSDDSTDPDAARVLRESVKRAAFGSSTPVYCIDRSARANLMRHLERDRSIPRSVVHFALFGAGDVPSYGANRNAILLQTQGTLALSLDQDVACRTGRAATTAHALRLVCCDAVEEAWFCKDRLETLSLAPPHEVDVVGEHERVLGATLATLVSQATMKGPVDVDDMCLHLAMGIATGKARVRVTTNGVAGDSGSENNLWAVFCPRKASRGRLASDESYNGAITSREIVRQAGNLTISHGAPWSAMAYGFDNRTLFPPFFPMHRGEDAICGLILASHLESNYLAHLPWTLVHAPTRRRRYSAPEPVSVLRMCDIVLLCLSTKPAPFRRAAAPDALRSLGALLVEYGSLRQADFNEFARLLTCQRASRLMDDLERQLGLVRSEGLQAWAEHLGAQIRALEKAVVSPDYWLPTDVCPGSETEAAQTVRERIRQYGELLCWWPAIWERARQVQESEIPEPERLA